MIITALDSLNLRDELVGLNFASETINFHYFKINHVSRIYSRQNSNTPPTARIEGHLKDAEKIYDIILDKDPLNCEANHNRGVLKIEAGNHEGSICFLERALQADPNNVQYWVSYTDALSTWGR